jgi:hypothetical protein
MIKILVTNDTNRTKGGRYCKKNKILWRITKTKQRDTTMFLFFSPFFFSFFFSFIAGRESQK